MHKLEGRIATAVLVWAALPAALLPGSAQTIVGVQLRATYPAAEFWVDGTKYKGQATFLWPEATKHILEIRHVSQSNVSGQTRITFKSVSDDRNLLTPITNRIQQITADRSITNFAITFEREHRVDFYINADPHDNWQKAAAHPAGCTFDNPFVNKSGFVIATPPVPGFACGAATLTSGSVQGTAFDSAYDSPSEAGWYAEGATITLNAFAYPGYVFQGWDSLTSPGTSYLNSVTVDRPLVLRAVFDIGRRAVFRSSPVAELQVMVDRYLMPARTSDGRCYARNNRPSGDPGLPDRGLPPFEPGAVVPLCDGDRDFLPGTKVLLAAPHSQTTTAGKMWVFDQWDLGNGTTGGQNTVWTVPNQWSEFFLTARFVPGVRAGFVTVPAGLKLKIDGRDNWPSLIFEWGLGHKHTVEAPLEQIDAQGRRYLFSGWSNGGPAAQDITVVEDPGTPNAFYMRATYELMGQLSLTSDPPQVTGKVNGAECRTPCTVDRPVGSEVVVEMVPELALSPDTKVVFNGWSDGSQSLIRTTRLSANRMTLRANYRYQQKLRVISDPEEGATWEYAPRPEPGNYFPLGARVEVTAVVRPGYKFRRWEGALSGPYHAGWVDMNSPQVVVARLDKVPALPENAVRNAAGVTPDKVVAPGSLISVRGYNLAPRAEMGPANPLTQTLQGVVVQVNSRILPLVSVAPDEIVAQLPSDFVEGEYSLTVRGVGVPALFSKFQVARNAPGLFSGPESNEDAPMAVAFHEDGRRVTLDNPAQPGETVSLLGTGFGPMEPSPLDGFAAPSAPPLPLKDTLEVLAGGEPRPHVWSGAAPGLVGYTLVKMQVDATMGQAQSLEFKVRINGRESNSVLLPLK